MWVQVKKKAKLQNTRPLICMSLNKNSVFCILNRSSKNAAKFKQKGAGYSEVAPRKMTSISLMLS